MKEPKYRRPLNHNQIDIIKTLYKFRFASSQLIADNQGSKHIRVITSRLKILLDQANTVDLITGLPPIEQVL